jgi:hypothetical protein
MQTRASLWLRLAAVIAALYAAGHTAGMPWTPSHELPAQAVVAQMQGVHFSAAGSNRSYWDFYQGFGLAISALLTVQAVLLWQLAGTARATGRYRAMAVTHLAGFLLLGVVSARYIFALPLWFAAGIGACLVIALLRPPLRTLAAV